MANPVKYVTKKFIDHVDAIGNSTSLSRVILRTIMLGLIAGLLVSFSAQLILAAKAPTVEKQIRRASIVSLH